MPTIQDELKKALGQWNPEYRKEDKPVPRFAVTNNVSRVTFEFVKNNPGLTATEAGKVLAKQGQNPSSVTSIMAQMAKQGTLRREGFTYFAVAKEYVPVSIAALKAARVAAKKADAKEVETVVNAAIKKAHDKRMDPIDPPAPAAAAPVPEKPKFDMESILTSMSVREAYAVYRELHEFFGAAK